MTHILRFLVLMGVLTVLLLTLLAVTTRANRVRLYCLSAATALLFILVAFHAVPFGMPHVWWWRYKPLGEPMRVLFPLVALALLLGALALPVRRLLTEPPTRRTEFRALLSLYLVSVVMAWSVSLMHPWGWMYSASLIINPASNSYFSTALEYRDLTSLLDGYEQKMRQELVSHAQTQSAGPVVLCGLLRRMCVALPFTQEAADTLFALSPGANSKFLADLSPQLWKVSLSSVDANAALVVALFLVGVGGLAVVPIYYLGKWLHSEQVGLWAAVGFTLLPSFHSFTVSVDQMYPFVAMTALCLVMLAMRSPRPQEPALSLPKGAMLYAGALGVWISLAVFMNLGLMTLILLCALLAAFELRRKQRHWRDVWTWAPAFIVGLLVPWGLLWVAFHYNLLAVFRASDDLRNALYAREQRSYVQSLAGNLMDFFAFVGFPVAILFVYAVTQALRDLVRRTASLTAAPLLWSLLFVLLALDLSGKVRGEAGRMWMFLMPCVLLIVAPQVQNLWRDCRLWTLALVICQSAQVVVFQYFVRVWGY